MIYEYFHKTITRVTIFELKSTDFAAIDWKHAGFALAFLLILRNIKNLTKSAKCGIIYRYA